MLIVSFTLGILSLQSLSLKVVVGDTGKVLASTPSSYQIPDRYIQTLVRDKARGLDETFRQAAIQLVEKSHSMTKLMPGDIYYQNTSTQPAFTRFLIDRMLGAIRKRDAKGLMLRPKAPILPDTQKIDDFSFELLSKRGRNSVYYQGEIIRLRTRPSIDGWLYCFYTDTNNNTIQLLPTEQPSPARRGVMILGRL